jgi:hypothetical protein
MENPHAEPNKQPQPQIHDRHKIKTFPRRPNFGMGDPVVRESQHDMVEYMTEVTRDMKRIMDEHTILMKQLLTVMTSIRDAQQQDRWNQQRYGR